jgi:hypothetical protein
MSEWTLITLKEYLDRRFEDSDKAIQAALTSAKEAVGKAEIATEKRFDSVNEFRAQLADQAATLLTRVEYDTNHKALEDKITDITDRINRSEGKGTGYSQSWGIFVALATLSIAVLYILIRNKS